jgi:hypothetical protein
MDSGREWVGSGLRWLLQYERKEMVLAQPGSQRENCNLDHHSVYSSNKLLTIIINALPVLNYGNNNVPMLTTQGSCNMSPCTYSYLPNNGIVLV